MAQEVGEVRGVAQGGGDVFGLGLGRGGGGEVGGGREGERGDGEVEGFGGERVEGVDVQEVGRYAPDLADGCGFGTRELGGTRGEAALCGGEVGGCFFLGEGAGGDGGAAGGETGAEVGAALLGCLEGFSGGC